MNLGIFFGNSFKVRNGCGIKVAVFSGHPGHLPKKRNKARIIRTAGVLFFKKDFFINKYGIDMGFYFEFR
jgi:hypothetical protein